MTMPLEPVVAQRTWQLGCCADKACTPETCMELPSGKTCGDCVHRNRCQLFGFTDGIDTVNCSFYPRRYREEVARG